MKRRILSMILALAMVLSLVTTGMAASSQAGGFVSQTRDEASDLSGGGLSLPATQGDVVPSGEGVSGEAPSQHTDETAITGSVTEGTGLVSAEALEASGERISASVEPQAGDLVTFVVELEQASLLDAGYTADEIASADSKVAIHEAQQKAALEDLKAMILQAVDADTTVEFGYSYTVASTGVSVTTTYENKATIAKLPGVKRVYVSPMFQIPETDDQLNPQTGNATIMIGSNLLNETGYTGKGMRIAIIDTGLELSNPSFAALSEEKLADPLTQSEVTEVWTELNASQGSSVVPSSVYRNTKVPFAFNYDNRSLDVSHSYAGSDHGTHVAGIAAANQLSTTSVVGVAPDAQLLIMQVFTSSGGAEWATVMAAMEDCVRLGVDVANLSLGSAAGYTDDDENMNAILASLEAAGVQVVIAAGNDTNNAYNNNLGGYSLASNPDVGLVGTPSTYYAALSVASADNNATTQLYFTVDGRDIGYNDTASGLANGLFELYRGQTLDFVVLSGYGDESSYVDDNGDAIDVTGKVVVVSRGGGVSFPDKQTAAQEHGAIACVVFNNTAGLINMQINTGEGNIPCVLISQADGQFLTGLGSGTLTVCADGAKEFHTDTLISDFSSWGSTSNLKLKPEITGVGGNIYSTRGYDYAADGYGYMSGTSMASPQVAGAMAVLYQYLEEQGYPKGADTWALATNLMMSTADPILASDTLEYSPRQQGAGLVDLVGATEAGAYLSNPTAEYGRPKAELGESSTGTYSFPFTITNLDDEEKSYTFDASLFTETYLDGLIGNAPYALEAEIVITGSQTAERLKYDFNDDGIVDTVDARLLLRSVHGHTDSIPADDIRYPYRDVDGNGEVNISDVTVILRYCAEYDVDVDLLATFTDYGTDVVTVAGGATETFTAIIELTENDKAYLAQFPNGMFVEGYLYVENTSGQSAENLSMPILGFYGDWSDAPVFDGEEDGTYSLYAPAVYTYVSQLGTNPYIRASQRHGDEYNAFSYANPLNEIDFGLLRNAKRLVFTVTDADTGVQYFEIEDSYVTKSFYNANYGMILPYYIYNDTSGEEYVWLGCDAEGNQLPSGTKVTYTVEAWLDDGDEIMDDVWSFQATLDCQAPEIRNADALEEALTVDQDAGTATLTLELYDDQYIAAVIFLTRNGEIMGKFEPGEDYVPGQTYSQSFNITGYGPDFTIIAADYACNETELTVSLSDTSLQEPAVQPLDTGRIYGSENIDIAQVELGWFSVDKSIDPDTARNETFSTATYFSGEYVNGYVVAQRSDGDLVLLTPYGTYWDSRVLLSSSASAEGQAGFITLYDMALQYNEGDSNDHLYAVGWTYNGEITSTGQYGGSNNLYEIRFESWGNVWINTVAQLSGLNAGTEMLTLAAADDGTLYGISTDGGLWTVDPNTGSCSFIRELTEFTGLANYSGLNVIQSMCYDHEEDVIYWAAHSQIQNGYSLDHLCQVVKIDTRQTDCPGEVIGTLGHSGASALFVPTSQTSDLFTMGVDPTDFRVSPWQTCLLEGQRTYLDVEWSPWNAKAQEITWSSSDESVATVNANGYITAVAPGTATITAKTQIWYQWASYDPATGQYTGAWQEATGTCNVQVLESQEHLYGYVVTDEVNASNQLKWITYADTSPRNVTQLGTSTVTVDGVTGSAMWQGGTYCNGSLYTVQYESRTSDGVIYQGTALYRSEVTLDDTGVVTAIGTPTEIGFTNGIEVGNIGFDYNTGRMYGVDLTHGGLCVLDLDTGSVDTLGEFTFEWSMSASESVMTAMCVICDGDNTTILTASMNGNLYTVDPDTMLASQVGSAGSEYWFYGAMTYDYDTGNIYWNPSNGGRSNPLYLVALEVYDWGANASVYNLGDVASSGGVEQTVLFTIPGEAEPDTKFIPVESLAINGEDARTMLVGGMLQLTTSTTPTRPTVQAKTWTSSDPAVATVDNFGMVTAVSVGTVTITVSLTDRDGSVYTDTITVTVLPSAGDLTAILASDDATGYWDFWVTIPDAAPERTTVGRRVADLYSIRAGEYYDGYFYGYTHEGSFVRVSADDPQDYTTLGAWNLTLAGDKVVDMAFDYTTGTMYALTAGISTFWGYRADGTYSYGDPKYGSLMTVDLTTGTLTEVGTTDALVNTLAINGDGTIYAVGSTADATDTANIYTISVADGTATCTAIGTVNALVRSYQYIYVDSGFSPQMTYDFATNRLYLKAADERDYDGNSDGGLYMIQLDETGAVTTTAALGQIALYINGSSTVGKAYLGLLCAIPDPEDLPVTDYVTGVSLNTTVAQLKVGETMTLTATVSPSTASQAVTWTTSDESVVTVDATGLVTAVSAGTATVTATAEADDSFSASCTITVVESTNGSSAYAITNEGLILFDPEAPNSYHKVDGLSNLSGVVGMDVDGNTVYYVLNDGGPQLYRYDMDSKLSTYLGELGTYTASYSDMAYDPVTQTVYLASGLYVYQYYVPTLSTSEYNAPSVALMPSSADGVNYGSVYGVTVADGSVVVLCVSQGETFLYRVDNWGTGECTFLGWIDGVDAVQGSTELAYDAEAATFYATNARNELSAFTLESLYHSRDEAFTGARLIGNVGGGLDITALTIAARPSQTQLDAWGAVLVEVED